MFATRIPETVAVAQAGADVRGRKDRDQYRPFLRHAEKYAREQHRVIGGRVATLMLLDQGEKDIPLDAYLLIIFSPEPLKDAGILAKQLYALDPRGLAQYTVMVPRGTTGGVLGAEASINVGQRELVRVRGLPRFRGVHLYEIISPEMRPGLFTGHASTPCLGPEVQLLEIYAALCDPKRGGEWPQLLEEEIKLRQVFLAHFEKRIQKKIEGGKPNNTQARDIRKTLVNDFLNREGRVWLVDPSSAEASRRLACVSVFSLAKEQSYLADLAERVGARVHFLENDPQLLGDPRLRRLTMYLKRGAEMREPVLDVYNSPSHEAIPYLHRSDPQPYKIVTAFGRARFILVDVWTIQLLWHMKSISETFALQQLHSLIARFRKLIPLFAEPEEAFPLLPTHFIGRIEDPILAEKRKAFMSRKDASGDRKKWRPIPFYPVRKANQP